MRRQLRNALDGALGLVGPPLVQTRPFRALSQSLLASAGAPRKATTLRGIRIQWQVQSRMDEYRTDPRALEAKEPETLDWIDERVRGGDVFFDIGANVGVYAIYAALRTERRCHAYSFEPEFRNFCALNDNILLNQLSGVVTAYCIAVADETRLTLLRSGFNESGQSGNQLDAGAQSAAAPYEFVRVQGAVCASLDDLVYRFGLPCPTHLKIDTDGAETAIVAGASRMLADARLKTVLCELDDRTEDGRRVASAFERKGLVREIAGRRGRSSNALFVRKSGSNR